MQAVKTDLSVVYPFSKKPIQRTLIGRHQFVLWMNQSACIAIGTMISLSRLNLYEQLMRQANTLLANATNPASMHRNLVRRIIFFVPNTFTINFNDIVLTFCRIKRELLMAGCAPSLIRRLT